MNNKFECSQRDLEIIKAMIAEQNPVSMTFLLVGYNDEEKMFLTATGSKIPYSSFDNYWK